MIIIYGTKKPKPVKGVDVKVSLPQEKPQIGKVASVGVDVSAQEEYFVDYVLFELINERTDKRAPLDKVTSRSRYLYRHNTQKTVTATEAGKHSLALRVPGHKEPSRNDKFIHIRWQLTTCVFLKKKEEDKEHFYVDSTPLEVEVV